MKRSPSLSAFLIARCERSSRRRVCGRFGLFAWGTVGSRSRCNTITHQKSRRGSTLLIVMALLGMMTMLGMLYFTFASQEQANATNFMEAAKRIDDPGDDIDAIFEESIRQLTEGARDDQKQSIFWGRRHSLVSNLYGNDLSPHSGQGINVRYGDANGMASPNKYIVDQDRDGNEDPITAGYDLLEPNDSPAARSQSARSGQNERLFERNIKIMPAPDVDYTYPDINFMALGYKSSIRLSSDPSAAKLEIIKPSFHRPELFRDDSTGLPLANWYNQPGYGGRSMRPHPEHMYVPRQGQNIATPEFRYLDPARAADLALIATLPTGCTTGFLFGTEPTVGANGTLSEQGVWSLTGVPTTAANVPRYEYDVDNDEGGSGVREGVWVDLDHNVLVRPSDNATYIPLISFSIYELDSLINVNTAGNLSGDTRTASATFGNGGDVSRSSMGLSVSEINPGWVLDTHPSEVLGATLNDHTQYFGSAPQGQQDLANTEIWWLKKGRIEYSTPKQLYSGVYGETNRLWDVLNAAGSGAGGVIGVHRNGTAATANKFPFPGIFDNDDNRDRNDGGPISNMGVAAGQSLAFVHPLAFAGRGRYWGTDPKALSLVQPISGNQSSWLRYDGMGVGDDGSGTINVGWYGALGGSLMINSWVGANFADSTGFLFDDPDEVTHDPRYAIRPYDEPIETKEMLLLHMSSGDRNNTGVTSRIKDLLPANLSPNGTQQYQLEVGQRLTTDSWDLQNFGLPRNPQRNWEFNVDLDQDGLNEFPPQFSGANAFATNDPFRPQLRRLLFVEEGNATTTPAQRRLNLNQLLDVEHVQGGTPPKPGDANYDSYYRNRPLTYRALTPHASSDTLTTLPTGVTSLPAYPPTTAGDQEFWARRDRQMMARDIYVMLYTFCGGDNTVDTTSTANGGHSADQLRQMAQFAVNAVDALDRDDVITKFEYDTDLSNGWDLDDNPSSADSSSDRSVVFGVEAQQLTFSEVIWFKQDSSAADHPLTPFDETTGDYHFIHMELRSVSPKTVSLTRPVSTSKNTAIWRIHRDDNNNGKIDTTGMGMGASVDENAVYFLNGSGSVAPPTMSVSPGGLYTIASADPSTVGSASLYVDHTGAATTFELISPNKVGAPAYSTATGTPNPVADLDLLHTNHSGYFALNSGSAGDFLSRNNAPGPGMGMGMGMGMGPKTKTNLRLDRRMNPNLPALLLTDNEFVTVDQFKDVDRVGLGIDNSVMNQMGSAAKLSNAKPSQERRQPFEGEFDVASSGMSPSIHRNSMTRANTSSPAQFNLFQAHFDRDFASPVELMNIPLCGPEAVTQTTVRSRWPATKQVTTSHPDAPFTFGRAMLMVTEDQNHNGALNGNEDQNGNNVLDSNHYHRFLGLTELATRSHRQLGDTLQLARVPGKIDLNGIRDPRVLAALIDDRSVISPPERNINNNANMGGVPIVDPFEDFNGNGQFDYGLLDRMGESSRDWWTQFLVARDRLDPISGLPLPQSGVSHPFRDLGVTLPSSFTTTTSTPIEDTILRSMITSPSGRPLFDLTNEEEHALSEDVNGNGIFDAFNNAEDKDMDGMFTAADDVNGNGQFDVARDPFARQRILSKVVNNSTTRGNVFIVYVTIGMFGCIERPNGAVRIGGQMDVDGDGQPDTHRAIYIIDRSEVEAALDKGSGTFDWKKLIKAKQRIN